MGGVFSILEAVSVSEVLSVGEILSIDEISSVPAVEASWSGPAVSVCAQATATAIIIPTPKSIKKGICPFFAFINVPPLIEKPLCQHIEDAFKEVFVPDLSYIANININKPVSRQPA
jgi:hypothetical protein